MLGRITAASATLFLSMVLAMVMMALFWFYLPEWFGWVQDGADLVEDAVAAIPLPEQYNNLVRIYASDDKIVLLIFTIIARFLLAVVGTLAVRAVPALRGDGPVAGLVGRTSSMMATLFLSFVLAIVMLSLIALTMEGVLHAMLDAADVVEDQLANLPLAGRWRSGVRFAVSDDKILLLFFTILARAAIALIATGVSQGVAGERR